MTQFFYVNPLEAVFALFALWVGYKVVGAIRLRAKTTQLKGPPSKNWFWGVSKFLTKSEDSSIEYESWMEQFGVAYRLPTVMAGDKIILFDPKAISHCYARETVGYVSLSMSRTFIKNFTGPGVLWAEGESHKRQRKALTPAFSNAAIRRLTPVFFDSAYKLKESWDALLESSPANEVVIDVQDCMNHISLDSIGIAGFSHNFGALDGKKSTIADIFDAFGKAKPSLIGILAFILAAKIPLFARLPTQRRKLHTLFSSTAAEISGELLERTRKEKKGAAQGDKTDHSVIGLLIKAENEKAELRMSEEEVLSQMKILILAGYETTSISLTWALIELAKNPDYQAQLREELLSQFGNGDPSYDQLTNDIPYLDTVVHETLRLHPPLTETTRVANEDDIIPFSTPVQTANGQIVDRISIAKGQVVTIPIRAMNRSPTVWGPDSKDFKPQRWIDENGIPGKAQEVQGHRHLLTFVDGPRTCLGKSFALAEFKSVLSVLIRNYNFDLRDGPDTKIEVARSILPRPKVAGEDGCRVPLRVRRLD